MARDQLIDLLGGGIGTYSFHINHSDEEQMGRSASVQRTAPVGGMGFIYQIGDSGPMTIHWKGTILDRAQVQAMWNYYNVCNGFNGNRRTIHLVDFTGARFEVLFTSFLPIRIRATSNPRGTTPDEKLYYYTYDATFDVINIVSGWP